MNNEELDKDLNSQVNGDDMSQYDYDPNKSRINFNGLFSKIKRGKKKEEVNTETKSNEAWMDRTVTAGKVPVGSIYTETDYEINGEGAVNYLSEFLSTILLAPFRLTKELSIKSVFLGREQLLKTIKIPFILSGACLIFVVGQDLYHKQPINISSGYASVVTCATSLLCSAGIYLYVKNCKENALVHDLDLDNTSRRSVMNDELKKSVRPETKAKDNEEIYTLSYEEFKQSAEAKIASGELSTEDIKRTMRSEPNNLFNGAEEVISSNNIRANSNDTIQSFPGGDDLFAIDGFDDDTFSDFGGGFN